MATSTTSEHTIETMLTFLPRAEWQVIKDCLSGEERDFFAAKIREIAATVDTMPSSYQTDGQGEQAIAYLHYFKGSGNWYITEKDAGSEDDETPGIQRQAFGLANLGYGFELGYIAIDELIAAGVELDLYWKPRSLLEIKNERGAA